jgi:hypothetical protein
VSLKKQGLQLVQPKLAQSTFDEEDSWKQKIGIIAA